MIKALEQAFGPKRAVEPLPGGNFKVTVTPPAFSGFSPSSIELTADQYKRYNDWREGRGMIQDLLPELSADQREILQSGIGPAEWDAAFKEDDE